MIAVEDGLFSGHLDFADVLFLIATIVFAAAAAYRVSVKPVAWDRVGVAFGLAAMALAFLLL